MATPRSDGRGADGPRPPLFSVVKGDVTGEELAALTVVLLARARADTVAPPPSPRPETALWHRRERVSRYPGPRSWRSAPAAPRK